MALIAEIFLLQGCYPHPCPLLTRDPNSKHSRIKNLSTCAIEQQWLALSVSSLKTQAVHQIDGYTILLQPFHVIENHKDVEDRHGVQTKAEVNELVMDEEEGNASEMNTSGDTTGPKVESTEGQEKSDTDAPRAGFQRFICAEYIDSLT